MKYLFSLFLLITVQFSTTACSCFFSPISVKHINETKFVFKGEIIKKVVVDKKGGVEMTGDQDEYANQYFRYTFRIDDLIKGDLKETTVDVYSATQGSMCGVNYNLGTKLLIYSHYSDGYFSTGSCSQNLILENITRPYKKILRKFKRSKKSRKWKNIDGKITAEGKVVKKVAQGAWTYYHEDGTVQSKGSYLNGQLHGEWVYYLSINDSKEHIAALSKEKQAKYTSGEPFLQRTAIYEKGQVVDSKYYR